MMRTKAAEWLYWLLGLPVATVLLLELLLQASSFANRQLNTRQEAANWLTGNLRVVTMGDSNTYGLYLQPPESYPAQLESLWNKSHEKKIEVINLGYPGANSSSLASRLPDVVSRLQPDIVLVMVGTNDEWTAPISSASDNSIYSIIGYVQAHSKTYRLYRLLRQSAADENATSFFDTSLTMRDQRHEAYDAKEGLRKNLRALMAAAGKLDVRIYLLTYAADRSYYRQANNIIRQTVTENQYPDFIDVTPHFKDLHPSKGSANEHFFTDMHATALGNSIVARIVAERLEQDLTR